MQTTKTTKRTSTKLATSMTDLASIMRFDFDSFNTFHYSFVLDKALQLEKTPITNPIVQSLTSILFPDAFKVLHYNLATIKVGNNVLTDVVIYPSHKTSFSTANLPEKTFSSTSAFALEFSPNISKSSFNLLDFSRTIKPVVRSDSEFVNSEVNAQNKLRSVVQSINFFRESEQEKTSAFFVKSQKTFLNIPSEIFFVTGRNINFEFLSSLEQSQNQNITFKISTSRKIISYTTSFNEGFSLSFFNDASSLFYTSNSQLCRQIFTQFFVNNTMEFNVITNFIFPSNVNTVLQGFSVSLNSSNNLFSWANFNFTSDDASHIGEYAEQVFKLIGGESGISSP